MKRWLLLAATILLLALGPPASRHFMEASMWRHMIVQFPLWMVAGALLASALPDRSRTALARWNTYGVSGLVLATTVLAVLMIPRVLDVVLVQPQLEAMKLLALLLAGAALRLSWPVAPIGIQFFFFGGALSMMAIVGMLYLDSPIRLCNAYLLDDQARLGRWLIGLPIVLGLAWLIWAARKLSLQERAALARARQEHELKRALGDDDARPTQHKPLNSEPCRES